MKLNPDVIMKENFDGNGILYDIENRKLMSVNATGVVIWKAIAEGLDIDAIARRVTEKFAVSVADAKKDAIVFLEQLSSRGILQD